jgi:hypothetical protein
VFIDETLLRRQAKKQLTPVCNIPIIRGLPKAVRRGEDPAVVCPVGYGKGDFKSLGFDADRDNCRSRKGLEVINPFIYLILIVARKNV